MLKTLPVGIDNNAVIDDNGDGVGNLRHDCGNLKLQLCGPAVALESVPCQVESNSVPLVVFQRRAFPAFPEFDLLNLVKGEVDGQAMVMQEVQVARNKLWIMGSQQIVAHVEKFQGEEVDTEVEGDPGHLVVGQV